MKLVLEPIFEADFLRCSYGFRPRRRAHDAVAEVHHFTSRTYEWVVEGDISGCVLTTIGCLAGVVPTIWTLIVPVMLVALVIASAKQAAAAMDKETTPS